MCQTLPTSRANDGDGSVSLIAEDCPCEDCVRTPPALNTPSAERRVVGPGDIVTIDLTMTPENGLVPEPLFDRNGTITFVVGWGNYLPALHELVQNKGVGDQVKNVSVDAGWGERNPDLVMELPKAKLRRFLNKDGSLPAVGSVLNLQGGIQLAVVEVNEEEETLVVDANPPLAGASYDCSFTILGIDDMPLEAMNMRAPQSRLTNTQPQQQEQPPLTTSSKYKVSTWALGCFWGGELAFLRVPGVVGTRVGYTQGTVRNPTYEAVCTGTTRHREAIMVIYDSEMVSYRELVRVALSRLAATNFPSNNHPGDTSSDADASTMFGDLFAEEEEEKAVNQQYHHGFYYHSEEQREMAEQERGTGNPFDIELKEATVFYDAEEYHQQYLLKGGQSARKGAKETIRCYG